MNILIVHEIDWINKVVFEPHHYAELLSKKGHNVFVIDCPDTTGKKFSSGLKTQTISNYSRIYNNASITLIRPPSILLKGLNRISQFFTCKNVIKQTVLQNDIDVILLYGAITNGLQTIYVARELKIPVIYRVLDISHGLIKIPIVKNLAKKLEQTVLMNSNMVLATTPRLSKYAIEMGAKEGIVETLPLGINTHDFRPLKKNSNLAKSLGILDDDNVLVFIGTIYPFSGLLELISDFKKISQTNPIKLLVVGGGPSYDALQKLVTKNNLSHKVMLTDFKPQKELPNYISLADICINPFQINYVTERILPTKIIEYLACGKPVLSTPLPGTVELLPEEKCGIVYCGLKDFANILPVLLSQKEKLAKLGKNAHDYAHKTHDWEILSDKLIQKLESVIP